MTRRRIVVLPLAVLAVTGAAPTAATAMQPLRSGPESQAPGARPDQALVPVEQSYRMATASRRRGVRYYRQVIVLKRGSRGRHVKLVQRRLMIKVDGVFGRATERAVRQFQRAFQLRVDGIVGRATAREMGIRLPTRRRRIWRVPAILRKIAQCESGGNPRAVSPNGMYRGKYQFDRATWRSVGGRGDPAKASEREQDRRALILYRRRGTSPWPSCA